MLKFQCLHLDTELREQNVNLLATPAFDTVYSVAVNVCETVGLRTRLIYEVKKTGLGLGLAVLLLFFERRSCPARRQ